MNRENSFSNSKSTNGRIEDTVIDMNKTVMIDKVNIYNNLYNENVNKLKDIKKNMSVDEIKLNTDKINIILMNTQKYKRLREEMLGRIKDLE